MAQHLLIKNQLYPFKFHIFLNIKTVEEIGGYIKLKLRKDKEQLKAELHAISSAIQDEGFVYEYGGHIIVVCKVFKDTPRCWDTLTHELTHAIFKAANHIGLKYSEESEEFFSYLMGFLVGSIKKNLLVKPKQKVPKIPDLQG